MSRWKDPVEQVVVKLSQKPSTKAIKLTRDAFRTMNARYRPGSLMYQCDHDLSRAAALLEYTVREHESTCIRMTELAKACCLKAKNFEAFHEIVGNHRTQSSRSSLSKRKESTIPSLAIKLGTLVHDPSGFATRAERLHQAFQNHAKTNMEEREGRQQLRDMEKHQAAYEAVCFYLIATKELSGSNVRRYASKGGNHGDDDNKCLGIDSMVKASKDFTPKLFSLILQRAQKMMEDMEGAVDEQEKRVAHRRRNRKNSTMRKASADGSDVKVPGLVNSKFKATYAEDAALAFLEQVGKIDETTLHHLTTCEYAASNSNTASDGVVRSSYSQSFVEWRRKVLTDSREMARDAIHEETGEIQADVSNDRAIEYAAEEVLKRFGVLI
jgi:hypothetical protein